MKDANIFDQELNFIKFGVDMGYPLIKLLILNKNLN